jgi:hypothetical protein
MGTGARKASFAAWLDELFALCDGVRESALFALREAGPAHVARPAGRGAGDVSFALDLACEAWVDRWFEARAAAGPLSLLTEDRGWRHRGPAPGGWRELAGFDHGGPRIALDPVDGTRNLMADLRPAWTVVSFAGPGRGEPRFADVSGGVVSELPTARTHGHRRLWAARGDRGCGRAEIDPDRGRSDSVLRADADDRPDHGYFPVFRYDPAQRPRIAALEAAFFARLREHEGADTRSTYDDQYISNGGQLVLLAHGIYRMIVDPRALLGDARTTTAKPYDVAGALVCAEAAGAVLRGADGAPLDFPLDARTPVHFAGWANEPTRRRLEPHWLAALSGS